MCPGITVFVSGEVCVTSSVETDNPVGFVFRVSVVVLGWSVTVLEPVIPFESVAVSVSCRSDG